MGLLTEVWPPICVPIVILQSGVFAGAPIWVGVSPALEDVSLDVVTRANLLRRLTPVAAYTARLAREIEGPLLLFGGAVIAVAERRLDPPGRSPGSLLLSALRPARGSSCMSRPRPSPQSRRAIYPRTPKWRWPPIVDSRPRHWRSGPRALPAEAQRFIAFRAGVGSTEIGASHAVACQTR